MVYDGTDESGHARYRKYFRATVNGVQGIVLIPDDVYLSSSSIPAQANRGTASTYGGKTYTTDTWTTIENKGCVFLPAAGWQIVEEGDASWVSRYDSSNNTGIYWSSTTIDGVVSKHLAFWVDLVSPNYSLAHRHYGLSVRLVRPVE